MKYTLTVNQKQAIELGIKNINQAIILGLISDAHTWAEHEIIDNEVFYWTSRQRISEELEILNLKPDSVYRHLKSLADLGLIIYKKSGKKDCVKLTKKGKSYYVGNKSEKSENSEINPTKLGNKSEKNSEINPTYKNTNNIRATRDNKKNINTKVSSQAQEIIDHLNNTLGTNYKATTPKTKSLIQARLKEGFTVDDFKRVHIVKFAEWTGTDMEKYLRPETLYSNKFEGYLNQKTSDYEKLKAINAHTGLSALDLLRQQGMAS